MVFLSLGCCLFVLYILKSISIRGVKFSPSNWVLWHHSFVPPKTDQFYDCDALWRSSRAYYIIREKFHIVPGVQFGSSPNNELPSFWKTGTFVLYSGSLHLCPILPNICPTQLYCLGSYNLFTFPLKSKLSALISLIMQIHLIPFLPWCQRKV